MKDYGTFNADGTQFRITRPDTPRPFDTMLFNDVCYANVHQTGIGCFDYQLDGKEGIQLLSGVGRICDYDTFGKEHLYNRLIYVRDNATGEYWTVNWEPVCKPTEEYSCTHGLGYTTIVNQTAGVRATLTITVPPGTDAVELWKLRFESADGKPRDLSVFTYFQVQFKYKWDFDSYGNAIYRCTEFDKETNTFYARKHPYVKPHDYLTAFFTADRPIDGYDGSRRIFMGEYGTAATPRCVVAGACTGSDGSAEDTVCALQWNVTLGGEAQEWSFMYGATDTEPHAMTLKNTYLPRVAEWKDKAEQHLRELLSVTNIKTDDAHTNRLMNVWARLVCLFGATWCRWGYNGYRDIVQQGMGVVSMNPARTKAILQEAVSYQYSYGMAVRGWNPMDDRPYSDSALWTVYTLTAYVRETGDTAFLRQTVPYLDEGEDTVLGHIVKALEFLENNKGGHGLVLIKFGDWNDSLTGAGKGGKGESVWLSMAYVYALMELGAMCRAIGEEELAQTLAVREKAMRTALETNAFEGDRYLRCFADDGTPIGSKTSRYAKVFLEAQSFALIIGLGDDAQRRTILETLRRESYTPVGYKLLSPAFREFDENVGRLSAMEPGIAENGTVYTHPNLWLALGMLRNGMADEAYDLFRRISPGYCEEDNRAIKENTLPFQYANCYFGPEHKNNPYQMEYSWITGSVAWIKTVFEEWMLGIRPTYDGLLIAPCLPKGFGKYTVSRVFRGCHYEITVTPGVGEKTVTVDGRPLEGAVLPLFGDDAIHHVAVTL